MNQLTVSLWGDEAFASILAQKNLVDIVTIVARDTSPPLHYILLHFWMQLFGTSEIAIRTFPMLLFVLLAFVVHKFAEDLFGKKAGYWAFFLTLLNPFLFLYAFEARMYMLLALTATLSMWFFVTKRWVPYILATAAALYTHHFSIFIVIVQIIAYILVNKSAIQKNAIASLRQPFILSLIAVVILYTPWLPALYEQTRMVAGDFWLARPKLLDLRLLYEHLLAGFADIPFRKLTLVAALILLLWRGFKRQHDQILYLWLLIPPILTFLISQISRPLFFDRYLIICAPVIPILLSSDKRKISTVLVCIIAIGLFFVNLYAFRHPVKQPFNEVARYVHETYGKDKRVINYYTNALHYFELKHYGVDVKIYSPEGSLPFWVGTALIDPSDVLEELPKERGILIMAGGDVNKVNVPGYIEIRRERFRDLYLLWFVSGGS